MPEDAERGSTLVELTIAAGILTLVAAGAWESLSQRPAQERAAIVMFGAYVDEARALASVAANDPLGGGDGATIAVAPAAGGFTATLYRGRADTAAATLAAVSDVAPLHGAVPIGLAADGAIIGPPFALVISSAGDARAMPGYAIANASAASSAVTCRASTGIVLTFGAASAARGRRLSCAAARLDTDSDIALP